MIANIHVGTFTTVGTVRTVEAVENEHTTAKIYEHNQLYASPWCFGQARAWPGPAFGLIAYNYDDTNITPK